MSAAARTAAAEDILGALPRRLREYCEDVVRQCGLHGALGWFRDPTYLAGLKAQGTSQQVIDQILEGLRAFQLADIERQLVHHDMRPAKRVIAKVRAKGVNSARGCDGSQHLGC